jgi:Na+/H+ antiporter NhaD/arsenite permease-like protein
MFDTGNPVLWVISSIVLVAFFFLMRGFFSAEARERRRRERSHRSVISQKKGPAVRLAVDVAKPKRDRTR